MPKNIFFEYIYIRVWGLGSRSPYAVDPLRRRPRTPTHCTNVRKHTFNRKRRMGSTASPKVGHLPYNDRWYRWDICRRNLMYTTPVSFRYWFFYTYNQLRKFSLIGNFLSIYIIHRLYREAVAAGRAANVPVIMGCCRDEGKYLIIIFFSSSCHFPSLSFYLKKKWH